MDSKHAVQYGTLSNSRGLNCVPSLLPYLPRGPRPLPLTAQWPWQRICCGALAGSRSSAEWTSMGCHSVHPTPLIHPHIWQLLPCHHNTHTLDRSVRKSTTIKGGTTLDFSLKGRPGNVYHGCSRPGLHYNLTHLHVLLLFHTELNGI